MEFRVGDRVRGISADIKGCEGVITKDTGCGYNILLTKLGCREWHNGKDSEFQLNKEIRRDTYWRGHLELISRGGLVMSRYDELKARIEKVEGWTKEADDILQDIYQNSSDAYYALSIGVRDFDGRSSTQDIRILLGESAVEQKRFPYSSQCSKNTAFKQALMWLLDNSSIKKDEIKAGDYVVAVNGKWFCGYTKDTPTRLKVGDVFQVKEIVSDGRYIVHGDGMSSCGISDVRKATPQEVEDYFAERKNKIAELERKHKELGEEIEKLRRG